MYSYSREAVRVKVKKCEMNSPPEWRKFSVDPQITSVEVLHSILAKAFEIKSDFAIYYRTFDPVGHETFLAVLSDWDLDAAFLRTHNYSVQTGSEPCLNLRVDVKSLSDTNSMHKNSETSKSEHSTFQQSIGAGQKYVQNMQNKLPGLIMNQMEKTFSMVQRALNFAEEQIPVCPPKPPLSDSEFRTFLDSVGQIIRPHELRHVIFLGGIDPSLRRVVWKHILNVYPNGMTGRERMDYIKKKAIEYYKLRDVWKTAVQVGSSDSELAYVTSMVKKDVLRTDRLQQFYAGNDDNQNIASLFNILTTYALNHPKVSYCQGMSDLASPLLVTMNDEAHAYICFCAIMERLQSNFMLDGIAMTQKFSHLTEALQYYDAEFYDYLKLQQADDLLFCYRWLLLELKREFPFEDSLRMLEVQWSSLRSDPPDKELKLFDKEFVPQNQSTDGVKHVNQNPLETLSVQRKHRENHYANICALRRQTSSVSLYSNVSINQNNYNLFSEDPNSTKLNRFKRLNHSLDENVSRVPFRRTYLMKAHKSLDEAKMLLLMKNISPYENYIDSLNSIGHFNEKKSSEDNVMHSTKNESKKIIFHSTNPFLNDAKGGSTEVLVYDDKNELNHFQNNQSHLENKLMNGIENIENSDKNLLNELNKLNSSDSESIISAQILNKHRGHFKELKEKIAASQKVILTSIDKTEGQFKVPPTNCYDDDKQYSNLSPKKSQKIVKNLNEFLNFTNNSRISDKLTENTNKLFKSNNFESNKSYKCIMIPNECGDCLINGQPIVSSSDESFVIQSNFNSSTKFENLQNTKNGECFELKKNTNATENFLNDIHIQKNEQSFQVINSPLSKSCSTFSESTILDEKCLQNVNIGYEKFVKNFADSLNIEKEIIYDNTDSVKQEENIQPICPLVTNNSDIYLWENPLHQVSTNSIGSFSNMDINYNKYSFNQSLENNLVNQAEDFSDNSKSKNTKVKENLEYDKNNLQLRTKTADQNLILNSEKFVNIKANIFSTTENSETCTVEKNNIEKSSLNPFFNELQEEESLGYQNRYNTFKINIENSENLISNDIVNSNDKSKIEQLNHDNFTISTLHNEEYSSKFASNVDIKTFLPPPKDLGGGNPFLIFLCLTLLLQHRNIIMRNNLDYNEMAMHFDKMVRKHDVNRVLNQARRMYFEYLKTHNSLANTNSSIVTDNTRSNLINLERKS